MIVDWSANNAPKLGADSIWLCDQRGPASNATTRLAAMDTISAAIREVIAQGKRLFIGFDFGNETQFQYASHSLLSMG